MRIRMQLLAVLLIISMMLTMTACSQSDDSVSSSLDEIEAYETLCDEVDEVTPSKYTKDFDSDWVEEFEKSGDDKKSEMAIQLADDMAMASAFGLINDDLLRLSGEAVKAYPHPLLLNNFAGILAEKEEYESALFFFQEAEIQEPQNPALLASIANTYLALEDYGAAEEYAKKAIEADPKFGPGYQVMTTIHLKNGNDVLAAETMVKSATNCFNDVTIYQFDSFLEAVAELDPLVDEYPLKEEYLDELYEITNSNVDTQPDAQPANSNVDIPEAQITIKPFPTIGSADHLMKSHRYLEGELNKYIEKMNEANTASMNNYYSPNDEGLETAEGVYPVKKNIRQIYALRVLQSYYQFKLEKLDRLFYQELEKKNMAMGDELSKINDAYNVKLEDAQTQSEDAQDELLGSLFSLEDAAVIAETADEAIMAGLLLPKLDLEMKKELLNVQKRWSEMMMTDIQNLYDESKQILEEYWLRSGGLLKYLVDEKPFNQFNNQREAMIYQYMSIPVSNLETLSYSLYSENQEVNMSRMMFNMMVDSMAGVSDAIAQLKEEEEVEEEEEGDDMIPEIEHLELKKYKEKYEVEFPEFGFEKGFFGFNASISFNGDEIEVGLDTPLSSSGYKYSISEGISKSWSLHGVKVEANSEWFADSKSVQKALAKGGKIGKGIGKLGKLGFGYTDSKMEGTYVTTGPDGATEYGRVYLHERGGEVLETGKSRKVMVFTSYQTGFSELKVSSKYKYGSFTVGTDN